MPTETVGHADLKSVSLATKRKQVVHYPFRLCPDLAELQKILCVKWQARESPNGMSLGTVRPSTIERTQSACNSVAVGKDSNSVGQACGKCVETMQKGFANRFAVCPGITASKGQETAGCVSEHGRKLLIEKLSNQRKGWSNNGESVPNGYICHASKLGCLSAGRRVYAPGDSAKSL